MEQNTKGEYKDVTENLRKLRGLSEDDISEVGLLKSRIEQQSELICILKQRADEYLKKYMEIENKTASIRSEMSGSLTKYEEEKKSHDILKDRFNTLDQNHVEMIKLKDAYKHENEKLRQDNEKLKYANENLFSEKINAKDQIIADLKHDVLEFKEKLTEADKKERSLTRELENLKRLNEKVVIDLKRTFDDERSQHKESLRKLEEKFTAAQNELTSLTNALKESNNEVKSLQEALELQHPLLKDSEIKINELQRQLESEKEKAKYLEQKAKKDHDSLSTNSTVRRLTAEVQEAKHSKLILVREFDAYKKHTSRLLNKERELNANLRRLNIP